MNNQSQLQALATVAFTVSELAAIASAVTTFSTLLAKIQTAAPNVWAEVSGDYSAAIAEWNAALRGPTIAAADASQVVNASGQLSDMPTELTHAVEPAGPTVASEIGILPNGPTINVAVPPPTTADVAVPSPQVNVAAPIGADAMGIGKAVQHVQV